MEFPQASGETDRLHSTTFNIDDWIAHTPKSVLARNFNVSESVFGSVPSPNPYIINSTVNTQDVTGGPGVLTGEASYVYYAKDHPLENVPGHGGTLRIIDTTTFPIATTIAATVVTLKPGGLRELHWHPNVSTLIAALKMTVTDQYRLRSGSTSTKAPLEPQFSSATPTPAHSTSLLATLPHSLTIAVSTQCKSPESILISSRTLYRKHFDHRRPRVDRDIQE